MWRTSTAFDECEKAALALTDAIVADQVSPEIVADVDRHFGYDQRVELTVTAAFYAMVPRVLDALGVPIEGTEPAKHAPHAPPPQVDERDGHPSPVG
jgi:alkylhydroperoxidase family enzyme